MNSFVAHFIFHVRGEQNVFFFFFKLFILPITNILGIHKRFHSKFVVVFKNTQIFNRKTKWTWTKRVKIYYHIKYCGNVGNNWQSKKKKNKKIHNSKRALKHRTTSKIASKQHQQPGGMLHVNSFGWA